VFAELFKSAFLYATFAQTNKVPNKQKDRPDALRRPFFRSPNRQINTLQSCYLFAAGWEALSRKQPAEPGDHEYPKPQDVLPRLACFSDGGRELKEEKENSPSASWNAFLKAAACIAVMCDVCA